MENIADIRKEYARATLDTDSVGNDPITAFKKWFNEALETGSVDVNAFVLSTVDAQNKPSARVVLIKEITETGLVFFTNYNSKKGQQLAYNPNVCGTFFWPQLERQLRFEGVVSKISEEESKIYFQSRPRESQAGAIVSNQSSEILDKSEMELNMENLLNNSDLTSFPKPDHWGGYLITINYLELWQGRPGRLHDRVAFEQLTDGRWRKFRLAP